MPAPPTLRPKVPAAHELRHVCSLSRPKCGEMSGLQHLPVVLGLLGLAFDAPALATFAGESPQGAATVELRAVILGGAGEPMDAFALTVYRGPGDVRRTEYRDAKGRLIADIDLGASVLAVSAPDMETHVEVVELQSPGSLDLGDVRLSRALTVRGRVVDAETGQALAGARVDHIPWRGTIAFAIKGIDWRPAGFLDTTDDDGTFELHSLAARRQVFVLAEGYRGRVVSVDADSGELLVELYPLAVIEGTLETELGSPAPGTVWLSRNGGATQWNLAAATGTLHFRPIQQQVGSDGHFRFEGLQSGSYALSANSPQGAVEERTVTISDEAPSQQVTMIAEHAGSISGTVHGLVEGETVAVSVEDPPGGDLLVTGIGNGAYVLAGVQDGPTTLQATAKSRSGFRTLWADVDVEDGQAWADFDFGFRSGLWGVVRAGSDRLASIAVAARPKDSRHPTGTTFTDREGRYELAGLADGDYEIRAEWMAKQGIEQVLNVSVAGQTLADIAFPTASIAGTAQVDSAGPWRANVLAVFEDGRTRAIWTDSAGGYRFEQLEEGRYTIMAAPMWTGDFPTVTVGDGGTVEGVDLQLTLAESRDVRFVDALSGQPLGRVDVEVKDGSFAGERQFIPRSNRLPITLAGHELTFRKQGYEPVVIQWDGNATSISLTPLAPDQAGVSP